jgi:hypothetical protein
MERRSIIVVSAHAQRCSWGERNQRRSVAGEVGFSAHGKRAEGSTVRFLRTVHGRDYAEAKAPLVEFANRSRNGLEPGRERRTSSSGNPFFDETNKAQKIIMFDCVFM